MPTTTSNNSPSFNPDFADWCKTNELAVKAECRWACYVSNSLDFDKPTDCDAWEFVDEQIKARGADEVTFSNVMNNIIYGGLFFFDTETELDAFYRIFDQPLTYSSALYACTYNPDGECLTENT